MRIAVSTESTSDLNKELIEKYNIKVVPYNITHGDNSFKDGDMTTEELLALSERTGILPKTNAINDYDFGEHFTALKKDYDAIIHISLSSGISCSCSNAVRTAKEFENVYIIDSLSLSMGSGLLAVYAAELVSQGLDVKDVYEKVSARVSKVATTFVIEKLNYLYKGGRCNSLQLLGANLLKLRPRINLIDGVMKNDKKYRGSMGTVIGKYAQELFEDFNTPCLDAVAICYTTATDEMVEAATTACKNMGFKNIYYGRCGATIASHCGEHTLGILFINDGE